MRLLPIFLPLVVPAVALALAAFFSDAVAESEPALRPASDARAAPARAGQDSDRQCAPDHVPQSQPAADSAHPPARR